MTKDTAPGAPDLQACPHCDHAASQHWTTSGACMATNCRCQGGPAISSDRDRTITIPVAKVEEWCRAVLADPEAIALRATSSDRDEGLLRDVNELVRSALHARCQPTTPCTLPVGYEDAVIEAFDQLRLAATPRPPEAGGRTE